MNRRIKCNKSRQQFELHTVVSKSAFISPGRLSLPTGSTYFRLNMVVNNVIKISSQDLKSKCITALKLMKKERSLVKFVFYKLKQMIRPRCMIWFRIINSYKSISSWKIYLYSSLHENIYFALYELVIICANISLNRYQN